MRIAYIAAGAGGMYCGSCIHDNTLAAALGRLGHEVALLPTYTPLRTDEESVSGERVFYGAVNVYLQHKSSFFRRTPSAMDWILDRPRLLAWIARRFAGTTDARELGALTLAVLQGEDGPQKKELEKLVSWLAEDYRPDVVQITNSMLLGLVRRLKSRLGVPVLVNVQGEDLFLDDLPEPFRGEALGEMRRRAAEADGFIAPSRFYAGAMAERLGVAAERMHVVPLGIRLENHARGSSRDGMRTPSIGYLARICPEKGLHLLAEAFHELTGLPGGEGARLRVAGYLGPKDQEYFDGIRRRIEGWGLEERVDYVGEVDLAAKGRFLDTLDVLSVPTVYEEPKGLFVLEALAHGVPVVQPRHGSFPEMVAATGGGLLVEPGSREDLARSLAELLRDPQRRRDLGETGRRTVRERFDDETMARATVAVYQQAIESGARRTGTVGSEAIQDQAGALT